MKADALKKVIDDIQSNSITTLSLAFEDIYDEQAIEIAEALTHNTALLTLDLSNNPIERRGALALSQAMKLKHFYLGGQERWIGNKTLQSLNLSGTCIGNSGASAIANTLIGNKTLTHLSLANNHLTDVEPFAILLNGNATLESLDLRDNEICEKDAKALLDGVLKGNRWGYHLKGERRIDIVLTGNKISEATQQKFEQCAKQTVYDGFVEGYKETLEDLHARVALLNKLYPIDVKTTKEQTAQAKQGASITMVPPLCKQFTGIELLPFLPSVPPGILPSCSGVTASSFSSLNVPVSLNPAANYDVDSCIVM